MYYKLCIKNLQLFEEANCGLDIKYFHADKSINVLKTLCQLKFILTTLMIIKIDNQIIPYISLCVTF